jgi:hypothetical protein
MTIFFLLSLVALVILIILAQLHSPINFRELFSYYRNLFHYQTKGDNPVSYSSPRRTHKFSKSWLIKWVIVLSIVVFIGLITINHVIQVDQYQAKYVKKIHPSHDFLVIIKDSKLSEEDKHIILKAFKPFQETEIKNAEIKNTEIENKKLTIFSNICLFICMILGMSSKTLWDAIESRNGSSSVHIDLWNLVKPMIISPIIFGVVMAIKPDNSPNDFPTYLSSFQNGFMWQTIFSKVNTK